MKRKLLLLVAALQILSPTSAIAQDVWRTPDGRALPETPSRKARNGLGVSLVITADADWQTKLDAPSHEAPNFTVTDMVRTGGRLAILTFVVNPKPDSRNSLNVISDIQVTRPDGSYSVNAPGLRCLAGGLIGPATNVRLCEAVIQFSADPGDQNGVWKVKVTVRDVNRQTEVPVEGTFRLVSR
jgi:hypothetical protein